MDGDGRGDALRARAGAVLAPVLFAAVWLSPLPLTTEQHRLLAITVAVIVGWISEVLPIPVTALLIAPAMVAAGITDAKTAFAPYADPLLFLFYGSCFIAAAMSRHGLDRRIAQSLLNSSLIAGVPWRTRAGLMVVGMLLSMWISNTASTAILMPILLGTMAVGRDTPIADPKLRAALTGGLLATAYACSVGGMGTLVGTPPNMITARLLKETGVVIDFLSWMKIGVPTAFAIVLVIYTLFSRLYPPSSRFGPTPQAAAAAPRPMGPLSRGEQVTALAFMLAIIGWVVPGVLKAIASPLSPAVSKALPAGGVAILASSVLFLFKEGKARQPVLPWREARDIDWGLIMLFGGGISLGSAMFDTGLARELGRGFIALTGVRDMWTLTAVAIGFTIFFTEVCSNTATSNMVVPLVIGVTAELGVSAVPPALGVGLAASCAFMMPIATGPNAIVYGTGHIPLPTMVRAGIVLNLVCGVVVFALLRVLCPIYGWT